MVDLEGHLVEMLNQILELLGLELCQVERNPRPAEFRVGPSQRLRGISAASRTPARSSCSGTRAFTRPGSPFSMVSTSRRTLGQHAEDVLALFVHVNPCLQLYSLTSTAEVPGRSAWNRCVTSAG